MYAHDLRAPTNSKSPQPVGICRRCGFKYYLSQLVTQYEWRGPNLGATLTRVCIRTCLDVPNEQLRTIIIGPDPVPPFDASPTFYSQQNASPGFDPGLAPLTDDDGTRLVDDDGNPIGAGNY